MAKQPQTKADPAPAPDMTDPAAEQPTAPPDLTALAERLDVLASDATALGEERVATMIGRAAKSARHADKTRQARVKKAGGLVAALKAQGLTAEEIVNRLSGEGA